MFPWAEPVVPVEAKPAEEPDGASRKRRVGRLSTATLPAARRRRTASSNWKTASGWAKRTAGAPARTTSASLFSQRPYSSGKVPMNNDGFMVRLGTEAGFRGRWYCGRILEPSEVPGASDQCGPEGGPQCPSCAEFQKRYEPDLNDDGYPVKRSTNANACFRFYCGRPGVVAGTGGQCGPIEGPQCPSCQRLQESFQTYYINDEGCQLRPGKTKGYCGTYYCGRVLGVQAIPNSDGRCGPIDGPQCNSCKRFQATQQVWIEDEEPTKPLTASKVKKERDIDEIPPPPPVSGKASDKKAKNATAKTPQMVKYEKKDKKDKKEARRYREEVRSVTPQGVSPRGPGRTPATTPGTTPGTSPGISTPGSRGTPQSPSPSRSPSLSMSKPRGKPKGPKARPRKEASPEIAGLTLCSECNKSAPAAQLLMCDMMGPGCRIATHLRCCRPPLKEIPEGDWYCEACRVNPHRHALHCSVCGLGHDPDTILLCDLGGQGCHRATHLRCCKPALKAVPQGAWYCAVCAQGPGAATRPKRPDKEIQATAATAGTPPDPSKGKGKGKGGGKSFGDALQAAHATRSQASAIRKAPTPSSISTPTPRTLD